MNIGDIFEGACPDCGKDLSDALVIKHPDNDEFESGGIWRVEYNKGYLPSIVCGPIEYWPGWAEGKTVRDFLGTPVISVQATCPAGHVNWIEQNWTSDWN